MTFFIFLTTKGGGVETSVFLSRNPNSSIFNAVYGKEILQMQVSCKEHIGNVFFYIKNNNKNKTLPPCPRNKFCTLIHLTTMNILPKFRVLPRGVSKGLKQESGT